MATKFSPCKGSYVLNQFPSNVMFGMNGFHVSASGAIQGHHGPLVSRSSCHAIGTVKDSNIQRTKSISVPMVVMAVFMSGLVTPSVIKVMS